MARTRFSTISEVETYNTGTGHHFFDPTTKRFFRSRIGQLYAGRYFITSEQFDADTPRRYTIRYANSDGTIADLGEFQAYPSGKAALKALETHLAVVKNSLGGWLSFTDPIPFVTES